MRLFISKPLRAIKLNPTIAAGNLSRPLMTKIFVKLRYFYGLQNIPYVKLFNARCSHIPLKRI